MLARLDICWHGWMLDGWMLDGWLLDGWLLDGWLLDGLVKTLYNRQDLDLFPKNPWSLAGLKRCFAATGEQNGVRVMSCKVYS